MADFTQEFKDQLKEGTFYYHKFGLFIKSKITTVLQRDNETLFIDFNGGIVEVYKNKIETVKRPSNIIATFEWCYMLKNEYDEITGYIGRVVE